jgi:Na+/melibiose symporter-like transporter
MADSDHKKEQTSSLKKIRVRGDDLKRINLFSYGIGHFQNDLAASCWFFFLSYYLTDIINIDPYQAGYIMLAGQISDAIATPLVGICSDRTNSSIGKRTPWYIGGTILTTFSFILIFIKLLPSASSDTATFIYYLIFPSVFNIGWASVQVSHMSLLPSLSLNKKKRDLMTRIRTAFTFISQTATLCLSFFFFWLIKDKIIQYQVLALSCTAIGLVASITFLILCKEHVLSRNIPVYIERMRTSLAVHDSKYSQKSTNVNTLEKKRNEDTGYSATVDHVPEEEAKKNTLPWHFWLKQTDFWAYIFVYMFVRLCINMTQSVIPYYLENVLRFDKTEEGGTPIEFSIILLISTVGSIMNALWFQVVISKKLKNSKNSRVIIMFLAFVFVLAGCLPMYFLNPDFRVPIYFLAFLFGIGFSMGLSTVSSLTNDVVGCKGGEAAFVYGAYSFTDKLSCGIALLFFIPLASNSDYSYILQYSMPIFPPLSLLFGLIIVYFRRQCKIKDEERKKKEALLQSEESKGDSPEINNNKPQGKSFIDDPRFTFVSNTRSHVKNDSHLSVEKKADRSLLMDNDQ